MLGPAFLVVGVGENVEVPSRLLSDKPKRRTTSSANRSILIPAIVPFITLLFCTELHTALNTPTIISFFCPVFKDVNAFVNELSLNIRATLLTIRLCTA